MVDGGPWVRLEDHASALAAKDAEIEKLTASVAKLREALGPFAREAAEWHSVADDSESLTLVFTYSLDPTFTLGHLRTAARVHEETKP